MNRVEVLIHRLDTGLPLPAYEHPGDAGLDLRSRVDVRIEPGSRSLVPTGIALALPAGFAGFVHPRSGIALRHGVTILNAPGTIDAGYRGEISVILVNHDQGEAFAIARGDRIAQLIITSVASVTMIEVAELPGSHRGNGGFGSTGGFVGTVAP